jgi:type IV secretion system protein VirD4
MSRKNEFLRRRPGRRGRNVIFDLSNLIIPVLIVIAGIIAAAQTYARLVGYDPLYTDAPVYVTARRFFSLPPGYRFYNPGMVFLIILSKPFDPVINGVLFQTYFPLIVSAGAAVLAFFVVSAFRGYGLNKNDSLYGSARWGTEKDLKKFGLTQDMGVVLAQFQKADLDFKVNPLNASVSLKLKKEAPLVCHAGGTNTLVIAPTRSGKGVGSIIPTLLNFPGSMIIFDPKGENFNLTAGFRSQFSRVLKFSPISRDTVRFNPLEEVELSNQGFADIGLVLSNMFEEPKGGNDGTSSFFDNNAQDLLTGVIFHALTSKRYTPEMKNLNGVLSIISQAAGQGGGEDGEEKSIGEDLLNEMRTDKHYGMDGKENAAIHKIIANVAGRCLGQNPKVRSDVFSTVFSKMRLFEDPNIAYVTGCSDFKLQDFYDSDLPLSLYLTVPFSDITRIAPVFKMLINFILNKFSRGEAAYGEVKLKNPILFLLDEFPVLGHFPFLSKTMGILAGYGITFYIVVQALNQIVDIYGQNHTFLDNCKTVMVYAPGKVEDAKMFSEMIGKESVVKESISTSGTRYAVSLNNINESSQEVARELMNPDELMKLPPTEALILNQGMPPYIAKKVVYYMDKRFKNNAYSVRKIKRTARVELFRLPLKKGPLAVSVPNPFAAKVTVTARTGFAPPATRQALLAGIRDPQWGLPSQKARRKPLVIGTRRVAEKTEPPPAAAIPEETAPVKSPAGADGARTELSVNDVQEQINALLGGDSFELAFTEAETGGGWSKPKRPGAADIERANARLIPALPPELASVPLDYAGDGVSESPDKSEPDPREGGAPA